MRQIIRASVLVLALVIPAFAGDIPNNVTGNIPNGAASTGNIPYGVTSAGNIPNNATLSGVIQNGVTGEIPYGVTSTLPPETFAGTLFNLLLSLF